MKSFTAKIMDGRTLSENEMADAMGKMMAGQLLESDIEDFLVALAKRPVTVDELTGAAKVLRQQAQTIQAPADAVDCCGTGGDGLSTYNISTAVAIISAACFVPVAKHGGGAATSKSGSVDVMAALGMNLDMPPEKHEEALRRFHFTFLAASRHHAAMKNVREVRRKIGRRTIFNLLGPLANPAGTKFQLIGVFDKSLLMPFAETLHNLGTEKAWVVHGADGMDEISLGGWTHVAVLEDGNIHEKTLTPQDFGLPVHGIGKLKGGDAKENAAALRALLAGEPSAYRDIVLANAAAVLNIHDGLDIKDGVKKAASAIDSGAAFKTLEDYIKFSKP